MSLYELTKDFFKYLVVFRQKAPTTAAPSPDELRADIADLFERMEDQVRRNPTMEEPFGHITYALLAFADQVIKESGWAQAEQWRQEGLEKTAYGQDLAGKRFFEVAAKPDTVANDVIAIHYLCLALGFHGPLAPDDPRLGKLKARLLTYLPTSAPEPPPMAPEWPEEPLVLEDEALPPPRKAHWRRGWLLPVAALVGALVVVVIWESRVLEPKTPATAKPPSQAQTARVTPSPGRPSTGSTTTATTLPARPAPSPRAAQVIPSTTTSTTASTTSTTATTATTTSTTSTTSTSTTVTTTSTTSTTVAPAPQRRAGPTSPGPGPAAALSLQVGVFVGPIQSGRLAKRLTEAGFPAKVIKTSRGDRGDRYFVVVEPLADRQEAEKIRQQINQKFKIKAFYR